MKRRDFLKRLGIGTAAIVAAPVVLSNNDTKWISKEDYDAEKGVVANDDWYEKTYSTNIKRADYSDFNIEYSGSYWLTPDSECIKID